VSASISVLSPNQTEQEKKPILHRAASTSVGKATSSPIAQLQDGTSRWTLSSLSSILHSHETWDTRGDLAVTDTAVSPRTVVAPWPAPARSQPRRRICGCSHAGRRISSPAVSLGPWRRISFAARSLLETSRGDLCDRRRLIDRGGEVAVVASASNVLSWVCPSLVSCLCSFGGIEKLSRWNQNRSCRFRSVLDF
jgi:hypothetical protein